MQCIFGGSARHQPEETVKPTISEKNTLLKMVPLEVLCQLITAWIDYVNTAPLQQGADHFFQRLPGHAPVKTLGILW